MERPKTRVVNVCTEEYDVYIGRPSPYGNPYVVGKDGTREEVIKKYKRYLRDHPEIVARAKKELKGKRLGCYCHPQACHGDVLVNIIERNKEDS